ncbi:MAG: carboxypeptidase regulatory-like domain-containing protein, partial [Oscillospiraceae bacterium]|nr:carboxypeptidase regulatory-like domain-containing protein [Oscillospiraceae bacterium]
MKRILTRIGTFLLAMLMLLSIPLVAFAVPENEVQEFSVSVNDELSNEYPDVYDAEPYDYDSAYDDSDEYDYDDDWGYETTDNDDHYSDPDAPELYLEEAAGSESAIEALSAPIFIHSQSDMVAFLNGGLGPNHGHFILEWSGALPVGALRGRGFVDGQPFTGIFDGNNNVISNLHLSPRGLTEPEATAALNDIGLFRVLGHGATIRNLTLQGAAYTDTISIADWNTVTGSIGLLAGRVMPGAHVIISDIDIVSSNMSFGGGRTLNNKRVGGLVGVVDVGSRLDITGITIGTESASGVTITLNITGTPGTNTANRNLQSAGGIIGMTAGSVNILGSQNAVNVVISNLNTGGSRVIQHAGGAIGRTTGSAHVDINNLTVRGTIGAQQMAGGLIGSTLTAGTTTIRGSTNYAAVTVGGSNTHVGGFIGWARNRTYIRDSVNRGNITHLGSGTSSNANAFGGFLGRAQGILEMHNVENIAPVQKTGGGRSRGGGIVGWSNNLINITGAVNHGNVGSTAGTAGGNLNSGLGGILGYVQFAGAATNRWVNLTNTENHGDIGFNAAGVAASRLRNGGIVGATRTRSGVRGLVITNALNTGRIQAAQVAGGILGWNQSDRTNISGVMNRGNVNVTTVGANGCAGGIVGRSARHDLTIFQSANEGNITAGASGSSSNTALSGVGGIVGNINRGTRNRILQSYNAGSVTGGTVTVGGIIGQIRRGGTTLIQDSYNIGTVNSRRGNHGTSGAPRWSGHGILGHRGSAPTVTIERVYNAGNVSGRPIFGYSTTNQATRRMVYRNVFWDMDIYIGNQRQDSVRGIAPGITGLYTAILTSGHVSGLNSGAWLVNGWLSPDGQTMVNQQWESYPYLSWQTGGVLQTEFFTRIDPGASHTVEANPTIVNFTGVASNVRTFNPYTVRPTAGHAGHPVHPVGNSTLSVTRLVNQRLSVGLISPNGVVGFGENELFEAVVMAVDAINGRVINHARLYQNGVFIEPQQHGFADGTTVTLADNLNAIALGYVVAPNWVLTQDMIDDGLIRIYMDRVPIDNIHVHVRNLTAVEDVPPRIHVDRNPALTRNNAPVLRQGTGSTPFFNISGAMWGDLLYASAHHFEAEDPYNPVAEFWFEMIIGGAGTAASPWIVAMDLHDIDLGSFTMEVVRTHDDGINEDGVTTRLPHGGRAPGFSELSNPTRSNNFLVEFRSRSEVAENPRGLAGSGTGTGTTNVANQWTVQGTTTNTEVRITPNWGQQIGGTGQNFSYRTTGWHFISDLVDHDDDGNILRLLRVPVEPEIAMNVRVVEEFTVRGMPWTVLIPSSELTLRYDADCGEEPSGEAILRSHVIPPSTPPGTFAPRLIAGDFLDASAPEFLTNTHEVDEGELYPDLFPTPPAGTVRDPIYITLTRAPAGVVHGFVLNATMLDDFDSPHAPISGARVTILNELGQVVGTAITGADGYYRFSGLATGQNYTVIATADNFGSGLGVPTPVYLPVGENAESHVFLRHNDSANGFMILLNIREMGTANNLGGYPTTAVLTYGTDNTRDSMFASPFRLIQTHVNTSLWREGEIEVLINRTGFVPRVTIEDIGEYIDAQAEHVAQGFILIDVEVPTTRITFNIYGSMKNNAPGAVPARVQNYFPDGEDGYVNQIIVPVVFGEPLCPLAMEPIIAWMGEQESGFAFWGWFTEEALDASGRSRNSYRRPTVGTNGFDISRVFTEELFNTYADADNNINLNAIWVLWGDVNDDDQVNGIDVSLVSQYVRRFPGISIVEPAAYVSRGPAITGLDVSLISQYVRRFPGIVLGQPLGRTLVLGAQMGLPDISAPEIWNRASAFDGTTAVDIGFREMPVLAANAPQTRSGGGTLRNTIGAHQIWSVSHEIGYRGDYVDIRLRMDQITAQGMCWT